MIFNIIAIGFFLFIWCTSTFGCATGTTFGGPTGAAFGWGGSADWGGWTFTWPGGKTKPFERIMGAPGALTIPLSW